MTRLRSRGYVGISEFGSLGVSTPHLVTLLFGPFLVYTVAIFVVTPHSFVTLHHHELVRPHLGRDFPHGRPLKRAPVFSCNCTGRVYVQCRYQEEGVNISVSIEPF